MRDQECTVEQDFINPVKAKEDILIKINAIDVTDSNNNQLLDEIYTLLYKTDVSDSITPKMTRSLSDEYSTETISKITEILVSTSSLNLTQKYEFLNNFDADKCVDSNMLLNTGHYKLTDLFYNNNVNSQMFIEFLNFGEGKQRAGKGEHALAILSKNITQKGRGDIDVHDKAVELKVASTSGSGRLGEGGVNPEAVKQIISEFPNVSDAINKFQTGMHTSVKGRGTIEKPQKSVNVVTFTQLINELDIDSIERRDIGDAIFGNAFGKAGSGITEVFSQQNVDPNDVLKQYITTNFDWYKNNPDMGGLWNHLVSIGIGDNSLVVADTGEELAKLWAAGSLKSNIPMVIPTQDPEIFFQVNPSRIK